MEAGKNGQHLRYADMDCRRCHASLAGMYPRVATLVGGYRSSLCADCLNDWEVYIRDQPEIAKMDDLLISENQTSYLIIHNGQPRDAELRKLRDERLKAKKDLFRMAETWCLQPVSRGAPIMTKRSADERREMIETRRSRLIQEMEALTKAETAINNEVFV